MGEHQHYRIVIIGGGASGISVASSLLNQNSTLDIAIIEPSSYHYYQSMWTLVGGGVVEREDTRKQMSTVVPQGTLWIKDAVSEFHPEKNCVKTTEGKTIGYEYLVVAVGIQIDWEKIRGLTESLGKNGVCSNYSYHSATGTWDAIRGFKEGNAVFTFPNTPIKCGGAPQKIMYLAEDYFRRTGVRNRTKVIYMCAGAEIFAVKKYADALTEQVVKPRDIETRFKRNLVQVRADKKEAVFENLDSGTEEVIDYDMLHVTPPMSAPNFIKDSPLASNAGWVDVNKNTTQHVRFGNIFGIGDCSSLPTSKTAAAVRAQVPVLVENLLAAMRGESLDAVYDGYTSCPLVTGYGRLILAEFDYNLQPRETFPFDQGKERTSMYLLKRFVLPVIYWQALLKGRKWPKPIPEGIRQMSGKPEPLRSG